MYEGPEISTLHKKFLPACTNVFLEKRGDFFCKGPLLTIELCSNNIIYKQAIGYPVFYSRSQT